MICCCTHPEDWHGDRAIAACLDMSVIEAMILTMFNSIRVEAYGRCPCRGYRPRQGRRSVWNHEVIFPIGQGVWSR